MMTTKSTNILICIDGSHYADDVCAQAIWAARSLQASVHILHVLPDHSDMIAENPDHTGTIGLGARSALMEDLAKIDEQRGRLDQEKGRLLLAHAKDQFVAAGIDDVHVIHRRGRLAQTIHDLQRDMMIDMVFIGKRGEDMKGADPDFMPDHNPDEKSATGKIISGMMGLGHNFENVVRQVTCPVFAVSRVVRPMASFAIAFDGKPAAQKAVDFALASPLLKGMICHVLTVDKTKRLGTANAVDALKKAGFDVVDHAIAGDEGDAPGRVLAKYTHDNGLDLFLTGAYSHSRMHNFWLGSNTDNLLRECRLPFILFH